MRLPNNLTAPSVISHPWADAGISQWPAEQQSSLAEWRTFRILLLFISEPQLYIGRFSWAVSEPDPCTTDAPDCAGVRFLQAGIESTNRLTTCRQRRLEPGDSLHSNPTRYPTASLALQRSGSIGSKTSDWSRSTIWPILDSIRDLESTETSGNKPV